MVKLIRFPLECLACGWEGWDDELDYLDDDQWGACSNCGSRAVERREENE